MLRGSYDNRQSQLGPKKKKKNRAYIGRKSLVSKETAVQLRWGNETLEFGIKQVDKITTVSRISKKEKLSGQSGFVVIRSNLIGYHFSKFRYRSP